MVLRLRLTRAILALPILAALLGVAGPAAASLQSASPAEVLAAGPLYAEPLADALGPDEPEFGLYELGAPDLLALADDASPNISRDLEALAGEALIDANLGAEFEPVRPKNRIGVFDFLGGVCIGAWSTVNPELHWGCGRADLEIVSELFQGLWTDPVTGMAYARARWYDSRNASWLSEDPEDDVDSPNLYAFVGWQPHMATDPFGLQAEGGEDDEIGWDEVTTFAKAAGKRIAIGTAIIVGTAAVAAASPVIGAAIVVGGVAMAAHAGYSAIEARAESGLDLGDAIKGGLADVTGISAGYAAATNSDLITGEPLNLTNQQRAQMAGEAVGNVALLATGKASAKFGSKLGSSISSGLRRSTAQTAPAVSTAEARVGTPRKYPTCPACLAAGITVLTANGVAAIDTVAVGDRVLTTLASAEACETEVDSATWRQVKVVAEHEGGEIEITMLRPLGWIEERSEGADLWIDLGEAGDGLGQMIGVDPVPAIADEPGRVVLSTLVHRRPLLEVKLAGSESALEVSPEHPLYSASRNRWVEAGELLTSEVLKTRDGDVRVVGVVAKAGAAEVFNIEVEGEHVFFAGEGGVLVHNCGGAPKLSEIRRLRDAGFKTRGQRRELLTTQRELQAEVNRQAKVVDRWLGSSNSRWARLYRATESASPNFAKGIRGRVLDRRMNAFFKQRFGDVKGSYMDQVVKGSGNKLRPDLYLPNLGGNRVIFDVGGPSKAGQLGKYSKMADYISALIPE